MGQPLRARKANRVLPIRTYSRCRSGGWERAAAVMPLGAKRPAPSPLPIPLQGADHAMGRRAGAERPCSSCPSHPPTRAGSGPLSPQGDSS